MKYTPGGYSWLGVAPESEEELNIEQLEDQIHALKKEYEKSRDDQMLTEIKALKDKIKEYRDRLH